MNAVEDIDSMLIDRSKFMADGAKYFELFEKHIPTGMSGNVLVMSIGNLDCLDEIMSLNKDAKYVIVENSRIIKCLSKLFDGVLDIERIENDSLDLYNIIKGLDMKFDCIIMNPPYQRNLHLKILAEAIKHLKDENSVCVNLSPVRWLQDPLAKYKKNCDLKRFEESVAKHIENLDMIEAFEAQKLFNGAGSATVLGVYKCTKQLYDVKIYIPQFVLKILSTQISHPIFDIDKKDGYRVKIPFMFTCAAGHTDGTLLEGIGPVRWFKDGIKDGKPWYEHFQRNQFSKTTDTIPCSIKFSSQIEAENFCKQYNTKLCKLYTHHVKRDVNISPMTILWLGDAINPRTGLKGYESEWTDDDLYKFFNITPEEQKVIEETMEKYK